MCSSYFNQNTKITCFVYQTTIDIIKLAVKY